MLPRSLKLNNIIVTGFILLSIFGVSISYGAGQKKQSIGRIERIYFPKHGISFEARVDTGAHTSSLHVTNVKVRRIDNIKYIEFDTEDRQKNKYHIKTRVYKESKVKSTQGEAEERYVIRELVKLGKVSKEININLNDRSKLKYNFLIGRNFLRGDFIVDVSLSHTLGD